MKHSDLFKLPTRSPLTQEHMEKIIQINKKFDLKLY